LEALRAIFLESFYGRNAHCLHLFFGDLYPTHLVSLDLGVGRPAYTPLEGPSDSDACSATQRDLRVHLSKNQRLPGKRPAGCEICRLATIDHFPNLNPRMSRPLRISLLLLVAGWLPAGVLAALPPLSGELAGQLRVKSLPGSPEVGWSITLQNDQAGAALLSVSLTAPGLTLQAEASPEAGTWRVREGKVDLVTWLRPALAAAGIELPPDLEFTGEVGLNGSGIWAGSDMGGTISAIMVNGTARSDAKGWTAEDITLDINLALESGEVALQSARVTIGSIVAFDLTMQGFTLEAAGAGEGRIAVTRAETRVLDGQLALNPFEFSPDNIAIGTVLKFTNLSMSEVVHLLPDALTSATGRLSGEVGIDWNFTQGVIPGHGIFTMVPTTPAEFQLAPAPGFLTEHVPARFQPLPSWLGPLSRWFSPENPAYQTLSDVELGRMPLVVDQMSIELYPDGLEGVRSATVKVSARPADGRVVERVDFTVNVSGPLDQVIKLGLDDRARMNLRLSK